MWTGFSPFHARIDDVASLAALCRCDKPLSLLRQMRGALTPNRGVIIIAIVFPFRPFVENGADRKRPTEEVVVPGNSIEDHMQYFSHHVFPAAGLKVEALSRAPYLCEGDVSWHAPHIITSLLVQSARISSR